MKLTGIFPQIKTEKVPGKNSESPVASKVDNAALPSDRVVLSTGSLDVPKVRDILEQTPEVRTDRVKALKEEIARGEYQVDPYQIADKMMGNLLSETLAK